MKIRTEGSMIEEVKLNLPAYFKGHCVYFKIMSELEYIKISHSDLFVVIEILKMEPGAYILSHESCTEEEFNEAFEIALNIIASCQPMSSI